MFNQYQQAHMGYLDSLSLEEKCYCGWEEAWQCHGFHSSCDPKKTRADWVIDQNNVRKVACPKCGAIPGQYCRASNDRDMTWANHQEREESASGT